MFYKQKNVPSILQSTQDLQIITQNKNRKYNQKLYHFLRFTKNDINLVKLNNILALHSKSICQERCHPQCKVKILDKFTKFSMCAVNPRN